MENAEEILIILLASTLILFLLFAILAIVKIVQILKQLKHITDKAEQLAERAENITEFFKYTSKPVAIGKFLSNIIGTVKNHKKSKRS